MAAFTSRRCHCIITVMGTILLTDQQTAAFLALEAKDHAECLEQIRGYGRMTIALWDAGCSVSEIRALITSEVN